jgi:hypothetical protein
MRRRDVISGLSVAGMAWPLAVGAASREQSPATFRWSSQPGSRFISI